MIETEIIRIFLYIRTTYGLFLLELNAIQERTIRDRRFPKRIEELFFDFLRLVPIADIAERLHFADQSSSPALVSYQ